MGTQCSHEAGAARRSSRAFAVRTREPVRTSPERRIEGSLVFLWGHVGQPLRISRNNWRAHGVKIGTSSPTQKEFISAIATDHIIISHSHVTVPRNISHDLLVDVV